MKKKDERKKDYIFAILSKITYFQIVLQKSHTKIDIPQIYYIILY